MILASPYTQIFWNEYQINQHRFDYNLVFDNFIEGALDIALLSASLNQLIADYILLDSHLACNKGSLFWQKNDSITPLTHLDNDQQAIQKFVQQPFSLDKGPLYRFGVLPLSHNQYRLVMVLHHALMDGGHVDHFTALVCEGYNNPSISTAHLEAQVSALKAMHQKQHHYVDALKQSGSADIWGNYLSDVSLENALPYTKSNHDHIDIKECTIPATEIDRLIAGLSTSAFNALLLSWGVLISKYCASDSSYINYPVKIKTDGQMLFGAEINANIAKISYEKGDTFKDIVSKYQQMLAILVNDTNKHTYLPIADIVKASHISRLNVGFAQTNLRKLAFDFRNCQAQSITNHYVDIAGHDILLEYQRIDSAYCFRLKYKSALFSDQQMDAAIAHYKKFLSNLWQCPNKPICDISLLDTHEYNKLVRQWNQTEKAYPKDKTLHQLFEAQAAKTPNNIAVVFEGQKLTYHQLNAKSNQLARHIQLKYQQKMGKKIGSECLIALYLERSVEMIISILAVCKAGGTYVPVDTKLPKGRITHILQDSQTALLLTQERFRKKLARYVYPIGYIWADQADCYHYADENLNHPITSDHLAYVMYTSGTTGQPKGVMVEHQSIINTVLSLFSIYQLQPSDNVTVFAAYVFDVFVSEMWVSLLQGARCHLLADAVRQDMDKLSDYFITHHIDYAFIPPSILSILPRNKKYPFKGVICAGEPCAIETGLYWSTSYRLFNYYGPTEAAIYASGRLIGDQNIYNIGRPINNTKLYILDKYAQVVPVGVVGELCISGVGLARGYLNQIELTQGKFIANPFVRKEDRQNGYARLYKTGDLCRFLPDGNIEYIGRNDFQLKIRGIRVEAAEIESALNKIQGIEQSVVIAGKRQTNHRQEAVLIAYYVAHSRLAETLIKGELLKTLPNYMMPTYFMPLEKLPLTLSGKIDRLALPEVNVALVHSTRVPPSNDTQAKFCEIWSELFTVPLNKVGVEDGFFSYGGNSIIAIEMVMKITQIFNKKMTVADIFKHQTIKAIANDMIKQTGRVAVIEKHKVKQAVLSSEQHALWFIEASEDGSSVYHIPIQFMLADSVAIGALEKALAYIVRRHEVLHSVINVDSSGKPEQRPISNALTIEKYNCEDGNDYKSQLKKLINTPFDLRQSFPISVSLFSITTALPKYYLVVNFHHIAFDGWSIRIFLHELETAYLAYFHQKTPDFPGLTLQYKDYALWQQEYLSSTAFKEKLDYWYGQLIGFEPLNLITDKPRPAKIDYHGDTLYFEFNQPLSDQLRQLASRQGISLYTLLLSAFYILLHKYSSQADIVIGTPMANRQFNTLQDNIGCFVNSVALRHQVQDDSSLENFILQISRMVITAQAHQEVPFEQVVKKLNIKPCINTHPIFQVFFSVQDFESIETDQNLWQWSIAHDDLAIAKFDLSLFIDDSQQHLQGYINYASALFEKDTIQSMRHHYQCILECLVKSIATEIREISLLDAKAYQKIVYDWNKTDKAFTKDKTIHQLFEAQAAKTPRNIALIFKDQSLTYEKLNAKSNQLARVIRAKYLDKTDSELQPDTLVALCLERSLEMVISILAVLKTGGAYVPIDPEFPKERIQYILADTKATIILTQSKFAEHLTQLSQEIYCIAVDQHSCSDSKSDNLSPYSQPSDLAYVIYTSGTTGKPKGVCLPHKGVVNRLEWMQTEYALNLNDRVLQKTPFTFDVSVWELLWANCYGAAMVLAKPDGHKDCDYLYALIEKEKITVTHFVPSMLDVFLENLSVSDKYLNSALRYILCSGEALKETTINRCYDLTKHGHFALHNLYGPTEASIDVTYAPCYKNNNVSIGRPIQNTRIYILDAQLSPMPIGVMGELYIAGAGLARGYLNQPELTQEKFIHNPFATTQDINNGYTRLYKTGDLCRWLPDGNIAYIGRNDFQVKIRGFRIELGEIENVLSTINGIKQVCVVAKSRTVESAEDQYLAAFYVLDQPAKKAQENKENKKANVTSNSLITQLKNKLPEYMIPSAWVELATLPLTANGKLDRNALPEVEFGVRNMNDHKPQGDLTQKLCQLYAEILAIDVDKIVIDASFFDLGGSSLLIMQLKHRLMAIPECKDLTITDLFTYPSIQALTDYLQKTNKTNKANKADDQYHDKTVNYKKDIAVIAISGAFSDCDNLQEFWQIISQKISGLTRFDIDYCRRSGVAEEQLQNPNYIPVSGHIDNIDYFDPAFWGLSGHDAKLLDPQIRKFIEHCWYVLDAAGYSKERKGLNIDLIAGGSTSHYLHDNILCSEEADKLNLWEVSITNSKDALATKASYLLGLKGASTSINTACSTGLVTIVEACHKLADGLCDMAIAGSVSLLLPHQTGYVYHEGMIMSKDGHCRTFDVNASGTVSGSGVGAVLLKRLSDAEKDKDNIIAVIQGYASNNDGDRKVSYTAPSTEGQSECIEQAIRMAGVSSETLDYIECHGTATELGDPIEITALDNAFKNTVTSARKTPCYLGAVKANIGHTDSAAGFAGFAKVCLMLQHKVMPAQVDYDSPNPELYIQNTPFQITHQNCHWEASDQKPRYAGVSSFGIGGTNAHIILREYQPAFSHNKIEEDKQSSYILPLSAKSHQALENYKTAFIAYLSETKAPFKDIIYTLQTRKSFFNCRVAVVCNNKTQAIAKLKDTVGIKANINIDPAVKKVFMFPGQGAQYPDMTLSLYQEDSDYRYYVNQCIDVIEQYQARDFKQILFPSLYNEALTDRNAQALIHQTKWAQLALFVVSFALAKLFQKMEIKPDICIGHSIGEYVAATLSGVFTLEDAIKLVSKRGTLMQSMPMGAMLSVQASADKMLPFAQKYQCEVAVINSPNHCVMSGEKRHILALQTCCNNQNIAAVILKTSHAYHSKLMALAATQYIHSVASVKLQQPTIPFISNVSGDWAERSVMCPTYWSDHIRQPVKFSQGIESILHQEPNALFIELGPGKALSNFVSQHKNRYQQSPKTIDVIPSAKVAAKGQYTPSTQTGLLGRLWCLGYPVKFNTIKNAVIAALPPYQFDYQSYWVNQSKPHNRETQALELLPQAYWLNKIIWKHSGKLNEVYPNTLEGKHALVIVTEATPEFLLQFSFKSTVILKLTDAIEGFRAVNKYQLLSNIASEKAYVALSQYLQTREIDCIIDCTTLTQKYYFTSDLLDQYLENGFYALFLLQKYLLCQSAIRHYFLLTQGIAQIERADQINPVNGTLIGAIRVLRHEIPQIQFSIIDIGYDQAVNLDGIINHTFSGNICPSDSPYAVRGKSLWVESIETIQDGNIQSEHLIKCNDVILITGGLGGIGLSLAYYISQKNKVSFILTSRKGHLSAKQSHIIQQIRDNQCTVEVQAGDVSDKEFIRALIFNIEKKYQKLAGVIHLAGSPPLSPQDKSIKNVKQAIAAKIYGVSYILQFVDKENLRYFIMASSLASIMGDIHRIEYCAANSYLDYQARLMHDILPFCQSLSINWLGWKGIGMAVAEKPTLQQNKLMDLNSVTSEEGSKLFYDLIKPAIYNQVAISKFNIEKLKENFFNKKNDDKKIVGASDKLLEKNLSKECYYIAGICLSVLEVDQISIYDNLFDLGLSSLDAIRLLSSLKEIGILISIHQLFHLNSIDKIYLYHLSLTNKTDQEQNSALHCSLLLLKKSAKAKGNIFFLHPVGGILTIYASLIYQLSESYNYYGIQNINLYNQEKLNFKSFEALSDYYLNEILKIQNSGEYILIGSSLGGTLAYEIARQLEKSERKIKFIAMIDTWAYFAKVFYSRANFESNIYAQIKNKDIFGSLSGIDKESFIDEGWKIMQLNLQYQPKNSHIPIYLYKAVTLDKYYIDNGVCADNGWQQYTDCRMKIYHTPGDHVSIHNHTSLGIIAKHLNQALDSVNNKQELLLV